jgi:YgiT-type zinc finger domain-containing protein
MSTETNSERLVDQLVTYTLDVGGRLVVVEHVPARVNEETGERFFAPETVERIQEIVWSNPTPVRMVEAPVFEFAA